MEDFYEPMIILQEFYYSKNTATKYFLKRKTFHEGLSSQIKAPGNAKTLSPSIFVVILSYFKPNHPKQWFSTFFNPLNLFVLFFLVDSFLFIENKKFLLLYTVNFFA